MYHETHIFMFGLKNEMLTLLIHAYSCFIHLQADRQTNRQTGGWIFCRCIDLRLVQSFNFCMQVLFAHLVYGDCSKIKMIILISFLRARRFQWFKMNVFSC